MIVFGLALLSVAVLRGVMVVAFAHLHSRLFHRGVIVRLLVVHPVLARLFAVALRLEAPAEQPLHRGHLHARHHRAAGVG